ncbi:MAG: phosphate ABC transporter permease subunit PstC [Candidatus Delongbacteria bacterium]|nr:phosphate ABC transporter permease subunit PstC [Candidatus Delongbacteria bacterium]
MLQASGSPDTGFRRKRFRLTEYFIEKFIMICAFITLLFIVLIFGFIFHETSGLFNPPTQSVSSVMEEQETYGEEMLGDITSVDQPEPAPDGNGTETGKVSDLLGSQWQPVSSRPQFGLLPLIVGSLKVAGIAIGLAAPIAIMAALYTASFAGRRMKEIMKPIIEILAGFPSVVIGFFSLTVMASLIQHLFNLDFRLNALTGGVGLSLAVMPVIYTISEDALGTVPRSLTEASLALGARKWETVLFVILPAATPGIFAAVLLGIGRAIGETMIILMATGNAALTSLNPFEPVRSMSATIGAEMAEVVFGDFHYSVLFMIGIILFLFSFGLNMMAEFFIRRKLIRKFRGS